MCKSRQVHEPSLTRRVNATSEDFELGDFAFTSGGGVKTDQLTDVKLNGQTMKVLIDTGALADIIARKKLKNWRISRLQKQAGHCYHMAQKFR